MNARADAPGAPLPAAADDAVAATAGRDRGVTVWLLLAGYVALFWAFDGLPYQDVPNHLARAVAIADLLFDGGARYGETFAFEWRFVPYVLGDVLHAASVRVLPPEAAARLWVIVAFAAFPAATWLLLKTWGASPNVRVVGVLASAFLGADWFLRLGFLNFRYGLALALLGLVAWERLVARPDAPRALAYALVAVAAYLMHLAALVFLVAMVGTLSLLRLVRERRGFWRYAAAGAPLLAFLAWHVAFQPGQEQGAGWQPALVTKVLRTAGVLAPTREPLEIAAALGFMVAVALPVLASRLRGWPPRAWEALALAIAFAATYVALPESKGEVWGIDIRALPLAWLFAALAAAYAADARPGRGRGLRLALVAVALLHLAVLGATLRVDNGAMQAYRALALRVPEGATVLPIVTAPRRGSVSPTAHAGSFATVHRRAVVPYTFTGDLGAPMLYFTFRQRPPRFPWQWWYLNEQPPRRWGTMLEGYDYLLIQTPLDWRRLPRPVEVVARNEAGVLARVRAPVRVAESAPAGARR